MFCTKCGKKIEEGSIFCEFCGTEQVKVELAKETEPTVLEPVKELKNETLAEVPKEIINKELNKFADHLEFLGYEIEKLALDNIERVVARHTNKNNCVFFQMMPNLSLFQVNFTTEKKHNPIMDVAVNSINKELGLSRFYYDIGKEDNLVVFRIEAMYVGSYSKEEFALFQDRFEKEQGLIFQHESFKIFLDEQ